MKIFPALFLCLFFGYSVFGQADLIDDKEEIAVEEISLARDDGNGKAGETTDSFLATNVPIHCFVQLNSVKSVTVKMNFVAVKTDGLKPETKVVSVTYKTNGKQNGVSFDASPESIWTAGDYRIDIFLDGKLARSKIFRIQKSQSEVLKENSKPPKNVARPKVVRKSKKS